MNIAVTQGVELSPTPFSQGLNHWSRGDGTPGSDRYDSLPTAAFVPADQDFGGALELQKTEATQKLRYMGNTPILPGVDLRVTARVKALSGPLPAVRIAAWAGRGAQAVTGLPLQGPARALTSYGAVVEVSAIVGTGTRQGVDMPWGMEPTLGHFGLDLTGPVGGVVRIDDLQIEDVSQVFLRDMLAMVDVRDYGATGNGSTDDSAAFAAADAAAQGRTVLVPAGTFRLANSVTFDSHVRFEGQVTMPAAAILSLTKDFLLPAYIDAFGGDETLALSKALQSLLNNADHESLDLAGRRVSLMAPLDVAAAVANRSTYAQRRVLRNGQIRAEESGAWAPRTVMSQASYSAADPWRLTNVVNVANVQVGSLVTAAGVGREIYVKSVNVAAREVALSQPLSDAAGTQAYTFTRFRYLLDFAGFEKLEKFEIEDVEFQCSALASGVMLPPLGSVNVIRNCVFNRPGHRGITSIGEGCQGLLLDHNQFISAEPDLATQARQSVALNTNANDVKIRNNRASQFRHFAVVSGAHSVISGNHFFQGDDTASGIRSAGVVLCLRACNATISGNYIDNCFIEWTNEREPDPDFSGGFGFAGLSVTNNVFLCSNVAAWFSFLVVKPYGTGHMVNGLNVSGNLFRSVGGQIDRVERVDTSFAGLNLSAMRRVFFHSNTYHNIQTGAENPVTVSHAQNSPAATWVVGTGGRLPFDGVAQEVESLVLRSRPRNGANVSAHHMPYAQPGEGPGQDQVHVIWPEPMRGDVTLRVRMDL